MPSIPRHIAAAALAAAALCIGAAPALASPTKSPTSPVTAKTPLVATITAEVPMINEVFIRIGSADVSDTFYFNAIASGRAADAVSRIHAESAQLPAKLEWTLGAYLQERGDNTVHDGETLLVYGHSSGHRVIQAGVADFRLSNWYLGHADSLLGVPHSAYSVRPWQPLGTTTPVKSLATAAIRTPKTLAETIAMGTPVLQQTVPADVETTSVTLDEVACDYYSLIVGRMHATGAQRTAQLQWLNGLHAQLRGDELLARGITTHSVGNPATGNREMKDALAALRQSNSVIAHADASLGVHTSGPSVRLPTHPIYYAG